MFKHVRKVIGLGVIAAAMTLSLGAYAFTASNTGQAAHKSGTSSAAVSGYAVSNVEYTYDAAGDTVTGVTFNLDAAASSVSVLLTDGGLTRTDCGAAAVTTFLVTCVVNVPSADHDQLSIAAQS